MSAIPTFRFRTFVIYKNARLFRLLIRRYLDTFPSSERFKLIDQIDRACLSIILNIAEGSAKRSDVEFARFLETSIASISEVIAGFDCACDDRYISEQERSKIESQGEILAKQIGSFMRTLRVKKSQSANKPICQYALVTANC